VVIYVLIVLKRVVYKRILYNEIELFKRDLQEVVNKSACVRFSFDFKSIYSCLLLMNVVYFILFALRIVLL
jgi:hypothetical protein